MTNRHLDVRGETVLEHTYGTVRKKNCLDLNILQEIWKSRFFVIIAPSEEEMYK